MVLQMRGTISPANPWDVMVDLFFYREPEELEDKAEEAAAAIPGDVAAGYNADGFGAPVAPGAAAEPWDEAMGGAPPAMSAFGGAVPVAGQWNEAPAPAGWDAAAAPVDSSGFGSGFDVAPGGY
jgi:small subunit ribosomal protein SAe